MTRRERLGLVAGAYIILSLVGIFAWLPLVRGENAWLRSDLWLAVPAAHYVANGAVLYSFEAAPGYLSLPVFPILLAPAAALASTLGLVDGYPFYVPRPSALLLYAPYCLVLAASLVPAAGRLRVGGRPLAPWAVAAAVALVAVTAGTIYGHYEDVLAVALLLLAAANPGTLLAALMAGAATATKTWALVAIPLVVIAAPKERRVRVLLASVSLPTLMTGAAFMADSKSTANALLGSPTAFGVGTQAWWIDGPQRDVGEFRALFLLAVVGVGVWFFRQRVRGQREFLTACALALAVRPLVEPVVHPYYLSAALGLAVITCALYASRRRTALVVLLGGSVLLVFVAESRGPLWWMIFYGGFGAAIVIGLWHPTASQSVGPRTSVAIADKTPLTKRPDSSVE